MNLFDQWKIGNLIIKNRFVMCAMGGVKLYSIDGSPMDDTYAYYIRRAQGGVGLIITRAVVVLPIGLKFKIYEHPELFEPLKKLTEGVHAYDAKIFLQLSGGAGRTLHKNVKEITEKGLSQYEAFFAPSDGIPNVWYPDIKHRGLTKEEIKEYVIAFRKMSLIAKNVGFDGVEIHAIHEGYLLDQFTISATNHRKDEYGGNLENRYRMIKEIISGIKNECGNDYPVSIRYSITSKMKGFNDGALPGEIYQEFGRDINEGIEGAKLLESAGADMLNCDNGSYDSWFWAHPPVYMPNQCNLMEATILKKHIKIPVVCAGKMDLPENAQKAINEERCDAIGIARAVLADPDYVNKLLKGIPIKPCIGCHSGCLNNVARGKMLSCAINPMVMREAEKEELSTKHKIGIIGAGISGLESAFLFKEHGYEVTVYEATNEIGGNFRLASSFSFKDREKLLLNWYKLQADRIGLDIRFGCHINDINSMKEDVVIVATGSKPKKLVFPEKSMRIESYLECHESIKTKSVVILGAGLTGLESAIDLEKEGHKVIIIDQKMRLFDNSICDANRLYLEQALKNCRILLGTKILELGDTWIRTDSMNIDIGNYTILEATGYTSREQLSGRKNVFFIGDVYRIGNVYSAVNDVYRVFREICKI